MSSSSTRRGSSSSRETLSGTHPASYPRHPPDRSPCDTPARTPDAEILQSATRTPLPSRPSDQRQSPPLPHVLRSRLQNLPRWSLPTTACSLCLQDDYRISHPIPNRKNYRPAARLPSLSPVHTSIKIDSAWAS